MDHVQIDQFNLVDRYLMGKLSSAESIDFEEHFVDCSRCLDQLQVTKGFLRDLRFMAAEQTMQPERSRGRRKVWSFAWWRFHKPLAWAAVCLVMVALAAAVIVYTRRLEARIGQAESLSEQWEHRYEESQQATISADRQHQAAVEQRDEQLRRLEAKLKDEEAEHAKLAAPGRLAPFATSPSIFMLTSQRGVGPTPSEAGTMITLPRIPGPLGLLIPLEGEIRFQTYRMMILDHRRRPIGPAQKAAADRNNSLFLLLRSDAFRPGRYSLVIEGLSPRGRAETVGDYPFQVIKPGG